MPSFVKAANYSMDYESISFATEVDSPTDSFDPAYVQAAIQMFQVGSNDHAPAGPGNGIHLSIPEGVEDFWLSYRFHRTRSINQSGRQGLSIRNALMEEIFRMRKSANTQMVFDLFGDGQSTEPQDFGTATDTLHNIVIHIWEDATHRYAEGWMNNAVMGPIVSVPKGTLGDIRNIFFLEPWGTAASGAQRWITFSEMLVSDGIDLRGLRVAARRPVGPGAVNTMTSGSYVDIGDGEDVTGVVSETPGQRLLWTPEAYVGPASPQNVRAVMTTARASHQNAGPNALAQTVRIGGANYDSGAAPIGVLSTPSAAWELNPATGQPWTVAEINSIEAGLLSANQ